MVTRRDRIRLRQAERQAEGYLELGMPEHALEILVAHDDTHSLSSHALYLWGEALRSLQRYEEAIAPLSRAAEADPDNIHVRVAMGWCHKRTARLDLAIQDLKKALEAEPAEALLHYNLACYFSLAGNKRRALKYLSQALAIDPEYRALVDDEPDFDPIRSDPDFLALTSIIV